MPERQKTKANTKDTVPGGDVVRQALEAINASEEFAASPRLKEILTYVVEEKLAGRSEQIKGKTIAADVYGRDLETVAPTDNIVRVEARRLRRVLGEYYDGSGKTAALRIHIDAGSYVPRFEVLEETDTASDMQSAHPVGRRNWLAPTGNATRLSLVALSCVVFLLVAGYFVVPTAPSPQVSADRTAAAQNATRAALMEKSPLAVQSLNLSDQARGLLFPVFDVERQRLAIQMFERAIELDETLPDGHAGKAQALATLAFLSPDPTTSRNTLEQATEAADRARQLGPASARAHGAFAWVKALSGEHEIARKHADIAVGLMPDDGYILDIDGVVSLLSGDAARAAQASNPDRLRIGEGRFGAPNIWGVANYMLGNHQAVVMAFKSAPASGAPVSAPSLIFLAASLDHIEESTQAKAVVEELKTSWPGFPIEFVLHRLFGKSEYAADIFQRLEKNGLMKEDQGKPDNS